MIRVRFAPSPTGFLHIGGVRTALFNYLYAKQQKGKFLLRIEDTDRERSRSEYEEEILDGLQWLGLAWDEEPLRQSERLEVYRQAAERLVAEGHAYEESKEGKRAIRFRMPKQEAVFTDNVKGEVRFDAALFDDLVILKSDGFPTYHLACVVDDHESEVSHVIRGDDHLSNTPRQFLLYKALGWKPPKYAHLPLILGQDGTPLSKRHGTVSLKGYREQGFLPEALLNYLALLGWSLDGSQEFFTMQDLEKKFSLKRINKSSARFDSDKLHWLNGQHLARMNDGRYLASLADHHGELSKSMEASKWQDLALMFRPRIKTLGELPDVAHYCFKDPEDYDKGLTESVVIPSSTGAYLREWVSQAEKLGSFDDQVALETMTRALAEQLNVKAKDLIHPLRFALTAQTNSPGLFELMRFLGKDRCLSRIRKLLSLAEAHRP